MTIFRDTPLIELTMSEEVAESLAVLLERHPEDSGYADIARSIRTVLTGHYDMSGIDDEFNVSTP